MHKTIYTNREMFRILLPSAVYVISGSNNENMMIIVFRPMSSELVLS